MKISIIAITCLGVLNPVSAFADNPLDKLIPRGRLFKKLKQEIVEEFGGDKAKKQSQHPTPTPAVRPDDRQRPSTANQRHAQDRQSAPATRPHPPLQKRSTASGRGNARRAPNVAQRPIQPSAITAAKGFGVIVQMAKNTDLVVTRVHPQGNGAKAGLRPGDIVKIVGGVKLASIEEYDQITKGLQPGDQMEFDVVRRGRHEKTLVQFGTPPAHPEVATTPPSAAHAHPSNMAGTTDKYASTHVALNSIPSVLGTAAPTPRASRSPKQSASATAVKTETEKRLRRTIESQRAKMQRMEQELKVLRKTTMHAIEPTENNWTVPELSSPN